MKTAIIGAIAAVLLFAVAAVSWNEAKLTRRIADAHERLATLHYDAEDDIDTAASVWNRVPLPVASVEQDVRRHRATVSYWLARYDTLAEMAQATGTRAVTDASLLLVSANSAFRVS